MTNEETVTVYYYDHDCDYISKYCDEFHIGIARIPLSKIREWVEEN